MYQIIRMYRDHPGQRRVIKRDLTLDEAQEHCQDPETSSSTCQQSCNKSRTTANGPWFDGYEET